MNSDMDYHEWLWQQEQALRSQHSSVQVDSDSDTARVLRLSEQTAREDAQRRANEHKKNIARLPQQMSFLRQQMAPWEWEIYCEQKAEEQIRGTEHELTRQVAKLQSSLEKEKYEHHRNILLTVFITTAVTQFVLRFFKM